MICREILTDTLRAMLVIAAGLFVGGAPAAALAQIDFEQEPINYGHSPTKDPVAALQEQIDDGQTTLKFDDRHGYLSAVLKHLDIDPSSQVLVQSKTSFQLRKISPQRPRALYFNDESYVGWVQGGDVLEIMATDPQQGAVFYTLQQEQVDRHGRIVQNADSGNGSRDVKKRATDTPPGVDKPQFMRDRGQCLTCHASSRTLGVPGGLVRSMFVDSRGQPQLGSGTFNIDHTSPFSERWGGWYVTGTHGAMHHMGNVVAERSNPDDIDREAGANVTALSRWFDVSPYPTPHSDIVALMVLEHQTQMQNHLTRANFECRSATHYDGIMNDALDRPADFVSESTERRIASVGDKLLKYLLFAEEFRLTAPVEGTSAFAQQFTSRGPRDSQGRSLRDFDLQTRLFKYPCSYMIYSPSFDRLPLGVKQYITQRLKGILTGKDHSAEFAHLTAANRIAILEILNETKPDLWNKSAKLQNPQRIKDMR